MSRGVQTMEDKEHYERNGAERTGGDLNAAEVDARFAAAAQAAIPRQRSEAGSFGRA